MNIPDYISPVVGYRVWRWSATGLKSVNGEPWLPGQPLAAGCRAAARGTTFGRAEAVHGAHEPPHSDCTCGVYLAKAQSKQVRKQVNAVFGETPMKRFLKAENKDVAVRTLGKGVGR